MEVSDFSMNVHSEKCKTPKDGNPYTPVAWRLADLPQGNGRPCVTARLVLADGTERTTMMANRTVRGLRMAVKNHPVLAELPERAIGEAGGR
jgi:hypothetical protein